MIATYDVIPIYEFIEPRSQNIVSQLAFLIYFSIQLSLLWVRWCTQFATNFDELC